MKSQNGLDASGQFLTFTLRDRPYAISIGKVKEINQLTDITPVPEAPTYIKGVLNLRGKIIPVTDLGLRFKFDENKYTKETCIIVIESVNGLVGMIVDSVKEVVEMSNDCIEPSPQIGHDDTTNYILGMGKVENKVYILLDTDRVFSHDIQKFATAA